MNADLGAACRAGDAERVTALLAAGADPDTPLDAVGTTPLMLAASPEVIESLLGAGASLHPTRWGLDALQVVASADESGIADPDVRLELARTLLRHGAPLERRNAHGHSRLYVAAFAGDVMAVETLLACGADPDDDPPPLAAACWGSGPDTDDARRLVDVLATAGADIGRRDAAGWHLLHAAAMPYSHGAGYESSDGPNIGAMSALVDHGAPVDVAGPDGTTALMLVAEDGALDALDALLAAGADPGARDDRGERALDRARATERRLTEILESLPGDEGDAVSAARHRVRGCIDRLLGR